MGYSPIVQVEYDDAGNSFAAAVDLGDIKDDSEHAPEQFEDEQNTRGEIMFAGHQDVYNINVFDTTKRAALLTMFKADDRIDVRFTRDDDTTVTVLDVKPYVGPIVNSVVAGGRDMFQFRVRKFVG
jgi:hypothetical protein